MPQFQSEQSGSLSPFVGRPVRSDSFFKCAKSAESIHNFTPYDGFFDGTMATMHNRVRP
jgi:hypothetical protein